MIVTVVCDCGSRAKLAHEVAVRQLVRQGAFSFGAHVADPRAFVMRYLTRDGWTYSGGRVAKSTIAMICPECRETLHSTPQDD